ncbi:hypothetical protein [Stenotrophomonas phage BUCT603B1]|nr:hypothetical protein [Stenotrophomonas phage BUCT603]UOL49264.1 hypothetical protein [Stenotrophomonas phage BUCT603B1]HDS1002020.1 head-tail adaptor protein [Stenotrophomonas maltophilia]
MGISASRLRHRVMPQRRVSQDDGWGGHVDAWEDKLPRSVWAEVLAQTSASAARNGMSTGVPYDKVIYTVTLRATTAEYIGPVVGDRLSWRRGGTDRALRVTGYLPSVKDPDTSVIVCEDWHETGN